MHFACTSEWPERLALPKGPGLSDAVSLLARGVVWDVAWGPCCSGRVCWSRDPGVSGCVWPWGPVLAGLVLEGVPAGPEG